MNNQFQRKLNTRFIIFKQRYLRLRFIVKVVVILGVIIFTAPFLVYFIIYNGYSKKLIHSTDQISDELTTGVVISDTNKSNLNYLTDAAQQAFEKREINYIYLYLQGDSQSLKDSDVQKLLDKVPASSLTIDRSTSNLYDICDRSIKMYNLSKVIILSFKDTAIRSTYICNNLNLYSQGFSPLIDETAAKVTPVSVLSYINDITKVYWGVDLKLK